MENIVFVIFSEKKSNVFVFSLLNVNGGNRILLVFLIIFLLERGFLIR